MVIHVHLLLETPRANICMEALLTSYEGGAWLSPQTLNLTRVEMVLMSCFARSDSAEAIVAERKIDILPETEFSQTHRQLNAAAVVLATAAAYIARIFALVIAERANQRFTGTRWRVLSHRQPVATAAPKLPQPVSERDDVCGAKVERFAEIAVAVLVCHNAVILIEESQSAWERPTCVGSHD